jgi:hypothetical protein
MDTTSGADNAARHQSFRSELSCAFYSYLYRKVLNTWYYLIYMFAAILMIIVPKRRDSPPAPLATTFHKRPSLCNRLLRLLHGPVLEPQTMNVHKTTAHVSCPHCRWQCYQSAEEDVRRIRSKARSASPAPPVVQGANSG